LKVRGGIGFETVEERQDKSQVDRVTLQNVGTIMATYTFDYRVDGEILHTAAHEFADDCCAIGMAERMAQRYEIEIWQYERLVAHVEMGGRGIDLRYARF
jgi:hypothetical protein